MPINNWLYSSKTDLWATPQDFFDKLNDKYKFTLDPCATHDNHKCEKYYTLEDDGLRQSWDNEIIFMNPPYWRVIWHWIKKASEAKNGIVVCLLPARTDTQRFHNYIYNKPNVVIEFIKGRLKFWDSKNSAPFPSMIAIFDNTLSPPQP